MKRQTVWLSTMMVLSLMLIGYYTMNNDTGMTASKDTSGASVTTAGTPDGSSSDASKTGGDGTTPAGGTDTSSNPSTSTGSNGSTPITSSDWYVKEHSQLEQDMAKKIDIQTQVLNNNNATAVQLKSAQDQLVQLTNLEGEVNTAHDLIVAKGYKDCIIMPNAAGDSAQVYVMTTALNQAKAVEVMNIVSQTLGISAANVVVNQKA